MDRSRGPFLGEEKKIRFPLFDSIHTQLIGGGGFGGCSSAFIGGDIQALDDYTVSLQDK